MTNIHSMSATAGRHSRRLTSAVLTLSLAVGLVATNPTPAAAATGVWGCFTPANANMNLVPLPVILEMSLDAKNWVKVAGAPARSVYPGYSINNCVAWDLNPILGPIAPYYYYRMRIAYSTPPFFTTTYVTHARWIAPPGQGWVFVQWDTVYCAGSLC